MKIIVKRWLDGVYETIIQAITTQITVASGGSQLAQKIDQKLKNVSFLHLEKDVPRILFSLKNKTFGQQFSILFNPVRWKTKFVQPTDKKFVHLLLCIHFLNSLQITSSLGHSKPTHPVICQSKRVFSINSKSCFFFYLLQVCQRANCRSLFCFLLSDSDTLEKTAPSGTRCAS